MRVSSSAYRPPIRITDQQTHIFGVADGKVAEHWANRDDLAMMRQLGAAGS